MYNMYYYIIPKLNLIVGWNPKVACTTIFYLLLTKLNHEIKGNIHNDMINKENRQSGKYDIYDLHNPKFENIDLNSYTKICIVRNPYERLISGIIQRSEFLVSDDCKNHMKGKDLSKNTITELLQNLKTHNYIEPHFNPQTININNFKFDQVIPLEQISKLYKILDLPYIEEKIGGHDTKYINNSKVKYYNLTIQDIYNKFDSKCKWSSNVNSWFTYDNIQLINEIYKDDFEWFSKNGFDYKIN